MNISGGSVGVTSGPFGSGVEVFVGVPVGVSVGRDVARAISVRSGVGVLVGVSVGGSPCQAYTASTRPCVKWLTEISVGGVEAAADEVVALARTASANIAPTSIISNMAFG